jgi:arginine-tRNA-protein transferase
VRLNDDKEGHKCGYCNNPKGSFSFGTSIKDYPVEIYEKMMKDGWRRCGDYVYIPNLEKSCCKLYTCRLNVEDFKINKEQKKVMKRFRKYLSGEYELNKEKIKKEMKEKKTNDVPMKIVDELKTKIENILKEYITKKNYSEIIKKYITIDNSLLENKLKELYVRKNTNKKLNYDYSIDFIYIINNIIDTYIKKHNLKFENKKNLDLELFEDFKKFYNSPNEELELFEKTGHINITDKTKPKPTLNKNEIKTEKVKDEKKEKNKKKEKKEKKKEKTVKTPEKYTFDYFPEIVNEPEINLPLKHIYTCELTDKIEIDEEKFKVYKKYQMNIHKETLEETTKDSYNRAWGLTNLIDDIGIKLPNDLAKKVKHPEMYPKKYGTYNFIHRIDGKIVAVGIWDILPTCLSSVYLYYDTDYQFLDLGVFTAIREIEYIKSFKKLIDNNFKYYMMGFYCETVQKLRYKGFYEPTELLDRYTMNFVYLKDVQNMIKDGQNHKLSNQPNNPKYKYYQKDEISKKINEITVIFRDGGSEENMNFIVFLNLFISKKFIPRVIKEVQRLFEILPKDLLEKIQFIADFN